MPVAREPKSFGISPGARPIARIARIEDDIVGHKLKSVRASVVHENGGTRLFIELFHQRESDRTLSQTRDEQPKFLKLCAATRRFTLPFETDLGTNSE